MKHEKISALVDGELNEAEFHSIMEELGSSDVRAKLDLYYKIGDALKAGSANANLSPEFAIKMAASLEAEPFLAVPDSAGTESLQGQFKSLVSEQLEETESTAENTDKVAHSLKNFAIPGIAAIAAVAVIFSPQFMFIIQANASSASCTAIAGAAVIARNLMIG